MMPLQVHTDFTGAAKPTYEIVDGTKKNILYLAVTILVGVMAVLGPTGCSQTPKIYKMPADKLEGVRSSLGRIGVIFYFYEFIQVVSKPAEGITGGAARGFVVGASTPVVIGAVAPVPGGTLMGLLVAPFTALAGGVYGATKGVSAEDIEKAEAATAQAIDKLNQMNLSQTFIEVVARLGNERTDREFVTLPEPDHAGPNEAVRYDRMEIRDVDTVLELRIEKAGLRGPYSFDPPSVVFIQVLVQLIQAENNEIMISENLFCTSDIERKYFGWAEDEGQLLLMNSLPVLRRLPRKLSMICFWCIRVYGVNKLRPPRSVMNQIIKGLKEQNTSHRTRRKLDKACGKVSV